MSMSMAGRWCATAARWRSITAMPAPGSKRRSAARSTRCRATIGAAGRRPRSCRRAFLIGVNSRMSIDAGPLVVTFPMSDRSRAIIADELGDAGKAVYLADAPPEGRAALLQSAGAILSHDTSAELKPEEIPLIGDA